ncbi:MAG: PKD domain-containing protein [Deltaproteobacteria bacterium]|nr:PKD domain-containing protein [Deltaproteobacteria bacterium]
MPSPRIPLLAIVALVACDNASIGSSTATRAQALNGEITSIALTSATTTIDEGGDVVVDLGLVCSLANNGASVLVDWDDGGSDLVVIAPPAAPVQGRCPAGELAQCDDEGIDFDPACQGIVHRYDDDGAFDVTGGDDVVSAALLIDVLDSQPSIAVTLSLSNAGSEPALPSLELVFAAASDADRIARVEVDWGDATSDVFTTGIADVGAAGSTVTVVKTSAGYVGGTFGISARILDEDSSSTATVDAVVAANVAPVITALFTTQPQAEGSPVTAIALVDNRGDDVLRFSFAFECDLSDGLDDDDFGEPRPGTGTSAVAQTTYADEGARSACVRVCDDDGACALASAAVTIDNVAPRLTAFSTSAARVDEGGSVTLSAAAADPGADPLALAFDCEDDGVVDGTGASVLCTYARSGAVTARVSVSDGDGGTDTRTLAIVVDNRAPVLGALTGSSVDEGTESSLSATATDAGGDAIAFEFDVDGNGIFDLRSDSGAAGFRFAEDGAHVVKVRACDSEGACSGAEEVTALVANLPPVISRVQAPSSSLVGAPVTVSVEADDVGGDALRCSFVFRVGLDVVADLPSQSCAAASVTLGEPGAVTVDVVVVDTAGPPNLPASVNASAVINVVELSVNVTASASPPILDEGGTTDLFVSPLGSGPYRVSYDVNADGDFFDDVDAVAVPCAGSQLDPCQLLDVAYPQNRANDIAFRVLLEVIDEGQNDLLSTAILAVEVRNTAPTLVLPADAAITEGDALALQADGVDLGVLDTLAFQKVAGPAALIVDDDGAISWQTGFADVGDHTLTVALTDSDGARVEATMSVSVAILDENLNLISDGRERALNDGELFDPLLLSTDSDDDGAFDGDEILAGTDPARSDAPTAPRALAPLADVDVDTLEPELLIANALSPRGLPLAYTFVVLDEAGREIGRIDDVVAGAAVTAVVFDGGLLTEGARFQWFAFANDGIVDGAESERGSFVVDGENSAPPIAEPLSPADGASFLVGALPTLEARAVSDDDGDDVGYVFAIKDAGGVVVLTSPVREVPFFTLGLALPVGAFSWTATTTDGLASSEPSSSSAFTIEAAIVQHPPGAPAIVSPDGVVIETTTTELTIEAAVDVNGDALGYDFELADNAIFAGAQTFARQSGLTLAVADLVDDARVFWRVRAFDGVLFSDWSNASFVVNSENDAPAGLALLSPSEGAILEVTPTVFLVNGPSDADGDAIEIVFDLAADEEFATLIDTQKLAAPGGVQAITIAPANLTAGARYFWRVSANDDEGGLVTVVSSFTMFEVEGNVGIAAGGGGLCAGAPSPSSSSLFALLLAALRARSRRRR